MKQRQTIEIKFVRLNEDVECQFSEKSYTEVATEYAKEKASKAVDYGRKGADMLRKSVYGLSSFNQLPGEVVQEETEDDAQMVDLGDSFTAALRTVVGSDEDKNAILKSEIMQKTEEMERGHWGISNIVEGFIGDKGQKAKQSQQEADIRHTNRQRI